MVYISFLLTLVAPIVVSAACYNPGPSLPPVHRILSEEHFEELRFKLDSLIPDILASPDGWTISTTSFALQITSVKEKLWDYYYTAPILGDYWDSDPTPVTGDTAFRIASISKTFTVYAVLLENKINLDDPVTKYIPELVELQPGHNEFWWPEWDEITIRSLASQLSGITREGGLLDLAADLVRLPDPISSGFPPVDERFLAPCFKTTTDRPCNASEVIQLAASKRKVFTTNDHSTYSNVAFALLGQVLERATGNPYSEIISSSILQPLGMNHTRTTKPKDSMGVIPHGPNDWPQDLGADIPTGGLYSTANDFSKYLQSILSSKLLPRATTNAWMKPHSWSSGINSAYGMPWEMLRTTKITPDGRAIDIITKGGSLTGYFSTIAMLPEFGLGVTILVAGNPVALQDLSERLLAKLVPAVEELMRREARTRYAGHYAYSKEESQSADENWSVELEVDDVGPGIRISEWLSNGTDFLAVYGSLKGMDKEAGNWQARLIPTGVYSPLGEDVITENWRLTTIPEKAVGSEAKIMDDFCMRDVDALMYNGAPLEEFALSTRDDKEVNILYLSGLRRKLFKLYGERGGSRTKEVSDLEMEEGYSSDDQKPLIS